MYKTCIKVFVPMVELLFFQLSKSQTEAEAAESRFMSSCISCFFGRGGFGLNSGPQNDLP